MIIVPTGIGGVYPSEEGLKQQINNATVIIATDNDKVIELCRSC